MRRPAFTPVHAMVVIMLLSSILSSAAKAQPAPCPAEYPLDPALGRCVDPETGEPVNPATGLPYDPVEAEEPADDPSAINETGNGETPSQEEIEKEMSLTDQGSSLGLTLRHYACKEGFDPRQSSGRVAACTGLDKPAFTYTITDYERRPVRTVTLQTGEGTYGETRIDATQDVPMAGIIITVNQVTGWKPEWVTCTVLLGRGAQQKIEPVITNGSVSILADNGDDVTCAWFNAALAADDQAGGNDAANDEVSGDGSLVDGPVGNDQVIAAQQDTVVPSGGSVMMSFFSVACPAGTSASDELDLICTNGLADVTYEVLSETETLARGATDGNGVLFFESVPDGQLAIVQSTPAGYGKPYVLCTHYSPTTHDREYAPTVEYGTGFMTTVAPGDDLNCTFFNFPAAGPDNGPTIMIQTRWCEGYENGFGSEAPLAEAEAACPPFSTYEEFRVSLDGQVVATDKSNEINGQVTFTKLPVSESGGLYGIALLAPEDGQTVAVYCDKGTGDGVFTVVPSPLSAPDQIDQPLVAGEILRCSWFINYPYGPTGTVASDPPVQEVEPGIILVARLCNPGADLTQGDINAICPTAGTGITFNVDVAGASYLNTTTNAEGVIDVPLPGGDTTFTITPQVPVGYGLPGHLCISIETGGGGGGKVLMLTADVPFHDLNWGSNTETTCTYYFPVNSEEEEGADETTEEQAGARPQGIVAGQDEEEGQEGQASPVAINGQDEAANQASGEGEPGLTVQALQCPPEVAGSDGNLEDLCTEPVSDLAFEILVDNEPVGTSVTDAAGNLAIPADAGAGMYQFRHQPSPQYLEMRTACSSVYPNGSTATGNSSASRSQMGTMYLSFDGASQVTCTFYFVLDPAAPQSGDASDAGENQATDQTAANDMDAGGSHILTLQFWTCPQGVDLAADPELLGQACNVEVTERSFMLTIDGVTTGETIPGADSWEVQSSPVYADIGPGISSSVSCESSWSGGNQSAAESQDTVSLEGGMLTLTVTHPGSTIWCDWFIILA